VDLAYRSARADGAPVTVA